MAPHQQNPPLLRPSSVSDFEKEDEKSLSSRPPSLALPYPGHDAKSGEANDDYIGGTKDRKNCSDIVKEGEDLGPVLSRIVTGRTSIVPRRQRRGLLATLTIIPEIENPLEYTRGTKTFLTLVISLAGASAPMASAVLFPALGSIAKELHSTPTITNLSVATYMLGMAIFPLWWSSFAERLGYRTIYLISFTLYVIFNICAALSVNIAMLIVFRTLSGASAASAQTIGAGTIASIYEVKERGLAMGYFYLGPLCGPLLSPIIGGALTQRFDWRSTQWFLAAFGALVLLTMVFCIPETSKPPTGNRTTMKSGKTEQDVNLEAGGEVLPSTLSQEPKRKSAQWLVTTKILLVDPLRSLKFVRYPPVLVTVYWASLAFGLLVCPFLTSEESGITDMRSICSTFLSRTPSRSPPIISPSSS
jgi:multidrug resistance protein